MLSLIPIAIQLAQFAPAIMRFFGAGDVANVAEKVVGAATSITGAKTPEEALELLKNNQELQIAFQGKLADIDAELTKAYLLDVQDARKRDAAFLAAGTRNYRADFLVASSYIMVAFIVWKVWTIPDLPEFAKATISLILGRLLGYIDQVFQFEFGSTKNNRAKDDTILNLAKSKE